MPTNFQYRLQQHESVPPAESWQNILLRLKEECHPEEIVISQKLTGFDQVPPADLWSAISAGISQPDTKSDFAELPAQFGWPSSEPSFEVIPALESLASENALKEQAIKEVTARESGKREAAKRESATREISNQEFRKEKFLISFNWPRVAIAAAVLGVAISALYYFVSRDKNLRQLTAKTNPGNGKTGESKPPAIVQDNNQPLASAPGINMAITGGARLFPRRNKSSLPVQQVPNVPEIENTDISYTNINGTDRMTSNENIAIPTQPIRDNQGNIIMDEKLISAPDVNYVTVTSPNGEQTKISKKFLHALSYMNAGSDDENVGIALQESEMWKWLFKEWRQKLLAQPSFIPSTTNFLDIMELKEILHENF